MRRDPRHPPSAVAVLRELELPDLAVKASNDQPDAGPGVEPAVEELQLWLARLELGEAASLLAGPGVAVSIIAA